MSARGGFVEWVVKKCKNDVNVIFYVPKIIQSYLPPIGMYLDILKKIQKDRQKIWVSLNL